MEFIKLFMADLTLFAEGGTGSAGAADGAGEAAGQESASEVPATRRAKRTGAYDNVVFGRQEASEDESPAAGEEQPDTPDPKARQAAWKDLIQGEYKDLFTQETQRIINQRFKQTKGLEEQVNSMQPVIDMLMSRYNIQGNDVNALRSAIESDETQWIDAADQAGMSVQQYMQFNRLQRENQALQRQQQERQREAATQATIAQWNQEAEALKQRFPTFDLNAEIQNPNFARLLTANVPMETAFMAVHADDIVSQAMVNTARATEEKVANNIRANGQRPSENGASKQSAFVYKTDVTKLTKADRAEAVRRAARGDVISW